MKQLKQLPVSPPSICRFVCCRSVVTVRPVSAFVQSTILSWLSKLAASSRGRESGDKRTEKGVSRAKVGTN